MTPRGEPVQVLVAVLTYRRTAQLAALLPHLVAQLEQVDVPAAVLVVDNDPDGGAATVADRVGPRVRYVHEPRPGIAAARNRALDEAAGADALVFIDDDEVPTPGWLSGLVRAWQDWRCAAVTGPVVSRFAVAPDAWVAASGAFDRLTRVTGSRVAGAATNNLLLDLAHVRGHGLRFDERLGLTGGEDTLFTHALVRTGGEIRWVDEAEVIEPVPAERATRAWVLRRTFRAGSSWGRARVTLAAPGQHRSRVRAELVARGVLRSLQAALSLTGAVLRRDVAARSRATVRLVSHAGLLVGLTGFVYGEYARPAAAPTAAGGSDRGHR
ncbi:glycosyltransferase family 2 protein [Modestobacter sp. VKM Ac-2985]|uniref:glycosyltransferase family 2 protein n=1 Tax=Modestobacter sp. VKM Ac-2985 TaxID=3004139 RepID=UPI0022ABC330|nr:glycosyltransferase family 2 protein [Modestobacter sp. VKM Ac-2985]MCZ2836437.1 glycosyltransferase family 2 protein [Modestobacter sp. VKM Ac-2985]